MSRSRKIAAVAIGVTVLVPAAAQAATRTDVVGPPSKVAGLPPGADSNAFYRKKITVHVGDKVKSAPKPKPKKTQAPQPSVPVVIAPQNN